MTMKRLMLLFTLISGMMIATGCDQLMPKSDQGTSQPATSSTDSATSSSTESEDATDAPTGENKDE